MEVKGIVRRIDDLGRVVIPKEIRQSLNIKEGTPMEITYTGNGIVITKHIEATMADMVLDLEDRLDSGYDKIEPKRASEIRQRIDELREILSQENVGQEGL